MSDYYQQHSVYTNPMQFTAVLCAFPKSVNQLCHHLHGLFLHYADAAIFHLVIDNVRYKELNQRLLSDKLTDIFDRDNQSLLLPRDPRYRILGICRDSALLLCAILREQGVSARIRTGFVNYVIPGLFLDTFLVEYYDHTAKKWKLADTRTSPDLINYYHLNIDFDLTDVPNSRFLSAAHAWHLCRNGKQNANRFGSRQHRGLLMIRNRLIQDLALLNKQELLAWDLWGLMLQPMDMSLALTDTLADLLLQTHDNNTTIRNFYESNSELHVPDCILMHNPFLSEQWVELGKKEWLH